MQRVMHSHRNIAISAEIADVTGVRCVIYRPSPRYIRGIDEFEGFSKFLHNGYRAITRLTRCTRGHREYRNIARNDLINELRNASASVRGFLKFFHQRYTASMHQRVITNL